MRDGVAVIGISGTIYRYGEPEWGLTGHDTIKAAVTLALQDSGVSALLLSFCSPGGVASGVPELAAWLASQTAKPVYAYADRLVRVRSLLPRLRYREGVRASLRHRRQHRRHLPALRLVRLPRKVRRACHALTAAGGRLRAMTPSR